MPDHIGYGLDKFEQGIFDELDGLDAGGFHRIILLDPRDASRSFQVHPQPNSAGMVGEE